jgi:hypothetical protein
LGDAVASVYRIAEKGYILGNRVLPGVHPLRSVVVIRSLALVKREGACLAIFYNKTDKMSMEKRTSLASVLATATVGRAAKLLVAVLLAAAAMTIVAVPERADAQEAIDPSIADSDGYVPIYEVCLSVEPITDEGGVVYHLGAGYVPYYDGYSVEGYILLDVCVLEGLGAGPNDIQRSLEHELGHAAGYLDSSDPSSFMYGYQELTGT